MTVLNINIGILGHVDSGKTTLSKALSQVGSTAAFDKSTQSQERKITLDLGFSAKLMDLPTHLKTDSATSQLQLTFVDCPGHASLIRTIIGGSQIIDFVILVIDVTKGIQTQTAECLVIAEITCPAKLIVALNKTDLVEAGSDQVAKVTKRIRGTLAATKFKEAKIIPVSASQNRGMDELIESLVKDLQVPTRDETLPFLFAVDHCFAIKGQGTVCTGTVLQGKVAVNQEIEIPKLKLMRKVKSMQMFRRPVECAKQGDRVGICLTQFNETQLERGILSSPKLLTFIQICLVQLNRVKYFKSPIRSKAKFHFSIGHETVMGKVLLFQRENQLEGRFVEELSEDLDVNAVIEFEKPVLAQKGSLLIGSKLDTDIHLNACRLAFYGTIEESSADEQVLTSRLKIYKEKSKEGTIQRLINETELVAVNLFKKESDRQMYIGLKVQLSTGENGLIEGTFGQTNKIKVRFLEPLSQETMEKIARKESVKVILNFKKFLYDKSAKLKQ